MMKKLLFLLFALLALPSWGAFVISYDYTQPSTLQAMGFVPSDYQTSSEGLINIMQKKVLGDQYATITYEHFGFVYLTGGYTMNFLYSESSNQLFGENWCGKVSWDTHSNTYVIVSVYIESINSEAAGRVVITSCDHTCSSAISGNATSASLLTQEVSIMGENALINRIRVTYSNFDLNDDGKVDPDDANEYIYWLWHGDGYNPDFDLNSDGHTDVADLDLILTYLNSNPMEMDVNPYFGMGDVNGNGTVNKRDYEALLDSAMKYENVINGWVCNNPAYDINGDGKCDFWDYYIVYFLVQEYENMNIPNGNIVFEDASTESYCVSLYDKNGDGKLSYIEAAAVTPSNANFHGNANAVRDLKHFDEFQYFTRLTSLPEQCFSNDTNLVSITLPSSIKAVSKYAFSNCNNLVSVTLPEGLTRIRDYGFYHCRNLASIKFPSTLDSIGRYAFRECAELSSVDLNGCKLNTIGQSAFMICPKLTSFDLMGVQRIESLAFCRSGLTEMVTDARHIGQYAFSMPDHSVSVTLLRNFYYKIDGEANDNVEGLHLPITNLDAGAAVRVNSQIFYDAYHAAPEARHHLHPYIFMSMYSQNDAVAFSCEVPVVLPEGSKIFIVTGMDHTQGQERAFASPIPGNVVPANTGVVIKLPNRELYTDQYWFFTANPSATASGNYDDNILIAAVGSNDYASEFGYVCCHMDNHFSNNEIKYGWLSNGDFHGEGSCSAFLAFTPENYNTFYYGAWYSMDLASEVSIMGDITGESGVDVTDINAVVNVVLGKAQASNFPGKADLNDDNKIDVSDINTLVNIILGKTPTTNTYTVNGVSFKMVDVAGGTFTMGATAEQGSDALGNEKPTHPVTLSNFSIGQTEVTQELWQAVMGSNPSSHTGNLQRPVERVTWDDCQTFITKLNQLTGKNFRLPTEAEWEYAARGGNKSQGYMYAGSNTIDNVAWYRENAQTVGSDSPDYGTHPVATKAANELGLYDMSGNVIEWCQDRYKSSYSGYPTDVPTVNPTGPDSGSTRVTRGGSWANTAQSCRVSSRNSGTPNASNQTIGLRLALGDPPKTEKTVTYDYTSVASLQAQGFDASEIPAYGEGANPIAAKVFSDQNASMAYSNLSIQAMDNNTTGYALKLFDSGLASALGMGQECGKVVWTANGSKKVKKVEIQWYFSNPANMAQITSSDSGATLTTEGTLSTCTFSGSGVNSFTISVKEGSNQSVFIKTIQVTYQ
jgi:formylglycine-generating enzyme required for sulfatase activity